MICKWKHIGVPWIGGPFPPLEIYEFDATSRVDEWNKARAWVKENGWRFNEIRRVDIKKEDSNG